VSQVNSRGSRIPRLRRRRRRKKESPEEALSSTKTATSTKLFPSIRAMNLLRVFFLNLPDLSWILSISPPKLFLAVTAEYVTFASKTVGTSMICWQGVPHET